jgi:hypothetical protein
VSTNEALMAIIALAMKTRMTINCPTLLEDVSVNPEIESKAPIHNPLKRK